MSISSSSLLVIKDRRFVNCTSTSEWAIKNKNKKNSHNSTMKFSLNFYAIASDSKKSSLPASSKSESEMTFKGSDLTHSCRAESWDWSYLNPVLQGLSSLKQWMKWSSDPSIERLSAQVLKDFTISQTCPFGLLGRIPWKGGVYWKGMFISKWGSIGINTVITSSLSSNQLDKLLISWVNDISIIKIRQVVALHFLRQIRRRQQKRPWVHVVIKEMKNKKLTVIKCMNSPLYEGNAQLCNIGYYRT